MTGVLPVALEDATRAVGSLLLSGKEYVCLMQLHADVARERLESVLKEFTGDIYQKPPVRASVKREVRVRRIYVIDLLEVDGRRVLFKVACQAGTYIRKLVFDAGEVLGCGAHMRELRRIRAGPFTEDGVCTLYDLLNAYDDYTKDGDEGPLRETVQPVEAVFKHVPKIYVRDSAVDSICHGADLAVPGVARLETGIEKDASVIIFTLKGEAVALARALMSTDQVLEQEHGITAKTVRVMMSRGTYPAMWRKSEASKTDVNRD